jgi:uncharacterized protein YndB with AHSA1/START domain
MKLSAKTDLEAPIAFVFAVLTDHPTWEREARSRGVDIQRPDGTPQTGVGATWKVRAPVRGKVRKMTFRLEEITPHHRLVFGFDGETVEGSLAVELLSLSPRSTRFRMAIDVTPKTLSARLFLNTLRLAKGKVQSRLDERLRQISARVEDDYRRSQIAGGSA